MKRLVILLVLLCGTAQATPRYPRFYGVNFVQVDPAGLCASGSYCFAVDTADTKLKLHLADDSSLILADSSGNTALKLKYPTTIGTLTIGPLADAATSELHLRFDPAEAGNTDWLEQYSNTANSSGARGDHVRINGWNCGAGGGLETSGSLKGAMCDAFEQYYITGGGAKVMEAHRYYVDPIGTQTRYMSILANLETPYSTGLYLNATTITMGSGNNNNAAPSFVIDASATTIKTPGGYPKLLLDDNSNVPLVSLTNGASGDYEKSKITLGNTGIVGITAKSVGQLISSNQTVMEWGSGGITTTSPNGVNHFQLSDDGPYLCANSVCSFQVRVGTTYTGQTIRPFSAVATLGLGDYGAPFAWIQTSVASSDRRSCQSGYEGMLTTVPGPPSTVQACLQGSDNNWAWRTIYTAP